MKTIDLKNFIVTGKFGGITLGMNKDLVKKILGMPGLFGTNTSKKALTLKNAAIWLYGNIEFYFRKDDQSLEMIYLDYLDEISGGKAFKVKTWIFGKKKIFTAEEMRNKLKSENINFKEELKTYGQSCYQIAFHFSSGVQLACEDVDSKEACDKSSVNALFLKNKKLHNE